RDHNALSRSMRGFAFILLADPSRDHSGSRHAKPHSKGIYDGQYGFGETHGSDGFFADAADKEHIDERKYGFHTHFEDHGNGCEDHRAADASGSIVLLMTG